MESFDYIVIGGGSGGSAVAGRLAVDGTRRVCLLEAGGRNNNVLIKTPGFMPFIRNSSNYKYETVPQKGLNGRIGYQPRGKGLGGSSAINAMVYIRGPWGAPAGPMTMCFPTSRRPRRMSAEPMNITVMAAHCSFQTSDHPTP